MKKFVLVSVLLVLGLTMAGCGNAKEIEKTANEIEAVAEDIAETAEKAAEEIEKNVEEIAETAEEAAKEIDKTLDDAVEEPKEEFVSDRSKVFEFLSNINVGWNLGNALDVSGCGNTVESEPYWGNPVTTKEMVDAVKAQGFNAIRIPVTWAEHLGVAPDYTIDKAWLDRVQEVVDYAVDNDMYIMIDTHHEENHWLKTEPENGEALNAELAAIWSQVAERFKDYDEKLIFEGMNEPRKVGSDKEWNGGTPEERALINEMNQTFVDTVRATGGNNETRLLVLCTYGNSPANKALSELVIPEDNNIAVAIHMYTPYVFTYVPDSGTSLEKWDGSKKAEIVNTIKQLDDYLIKKDVPVIITEFGAQYKDNTDEIIKWLDDYMGFMNKYGIKCFWWDNNDFEYLEGERFGIFDRATLKWTQPKVADELVKLGNEGLIKEAE